MPKSSSAVVKEKSKTDVSKLLKLAREEHFFWVIDEDNNISTKKAVIGGAKTKFKADSEFVYYPDHRICGAASNVKAFASNHNIKPTNPITSPDSPAYQSELDRYQEYRERNKETIAAEAKRLLVSGPKAESPQKQKETLADKEKRVPQGKALNVSKPGAYKTVSYNNSGKLIGVHGLKIVSDNLEGFEAALVDLNIDQNKKAAYVAAYQAQSALV